MSGSRKRRKPPERASKGVPTSGEPPTWAVAAVVASIAFLFLITLLPDSWQAWLPTSTAGILALMALPVITILVAMATHAALTVHRAKDWKQAEGRITRSRMSSRSSAPRRQIETVLNVPDITYSFTVGGKAYQGTRVSLGNVSGKFAVEALERYLVGTAVTVHYDPADPASSVLERDLPDGALRGCGLVLALCVLLGACTYWVSTSGADALQRVLPRANVPLMLLSGGLGCVVFVFFIGFRNQLGRANSWPAVTGRVVESRIEERVTSDDNGTKHLSYVPIVEYQYQVAGNRFASRRIALGAQISGSQNIVRKITGRYPAGAEVMVHYDPGDPSAAALEIRTGSSWALLAIALVCFAVALYASHAFR